VENPSWSLALRDIPQPDFADAAIVPLPAGATTDPRVWAEEMFRLRTMPAWVAAALAVRQAVVPLLGIRRAPRDHVHDPGAGRRRGADGRGRHPPGLPVCCRGRPGGPAGPGDHDRPAARLAWPALLRAGPLLHPVVVQAMVKTAGERLAAGT
jgi:hypothetical protein